MRNLYIIEFYVNIHNVQLSYMKPFGSDQIELISTEKTKRAVQLDLFISGIIQEAAIVYFVFENLLGSQYYIVPFYPTQSSGIRFGLSWELFD